MPFITQLQFLNSFPGFKKNDILYIDTTGDIQIISEEKHIQPIDTNSVFGNDKDFKRTRLKRNLDNDVLDCNVVVDKTSNQYQHKIMKYIYNKYEYCNNIKYYAVLAIFILILCSLLGTLIFLITWASIAESKKNY